MKLLLKLILATLLVCLVGFLGWLYMIASAFGAFDKVYSRQDLLDAYESNIEEINSLNAYYSSIVPVGKIVDIEFEDDDISMISVAWKEGTSDKYDKLWKSPNSMQAIDSLVHTLGWKRETIEQLEDKLKKANCISIKNGTPTVIGFQRSGLGIYFFNVFDKPIPDSLKQQYDRSCAYAIYSNKLVLQYGGGAIGPQCFLKED